mgnify:CR=1 FL=1
MQLVLQQRSPETSNLKFERFLFRVLVFLLLIGSVVRGYAQTNKPLNGELYKENTVSSIFISIPKDSLAALLDWDNRFSDHHYKANFVFRNNTVSDTVYDVGFRLRGNTARSASKKSFKISFNTFNQGREYRGVQKLNLIGQHNDPSIARSKLAYNFLEYLEIPASRANYAKLYINNQYLGLYLNVENIDEKFTQSRFDGEGNLYKCTYGADLSYIGNSADDYKKEYYELKNPNSATAYEDLAHFIDVLNNSDDAGFECEIEKVFNVNTYLKSIVFDLLAGHWDGPNYNKNNFYLYFNIKTKQFEFISYDLDNTYGIDFLNQNWASRNIYSWSKSGSKRPLYQKIMENSTFRGRYNKILTQALIEYFNETNLEPQIDNIRSLINTAALADSFRTLDYGYTEMDFKNSFSYYSKDHVEYGLKDYVAKRATSANNQINGSVSSKVIPYWHSLDVDYQNDSLTFFLKTDSIGTYIVHYNWDFQSSVWQDTMVLQDAETKIYKAALPWRIGMNQVTFWYSYNSKVIYPSCDAFVFEKSILNNNLHINEFMAKNNATIADENGDFDDWVELYYSGNIPTTLSDYYLTDDIDNPFKFKLPNTTILPKSYPLIWADKEIEQGKWHSNFKLSAAGEEIALFNKNGVFLDHIVFGEQKEDVSLGRKIDGIGEWVDFEAPTPRLSNNANASTTFDQIKQASFYPNPANSFLYWEHIDALSINLYNTSLKLVKQVFNTRVVEVGELSNGVYFAEVYLLNGEVSRQKIVILH